MTDASFPTERPLEIEVDPREQATVITLRGSADMGTAQQLEDTLLEVSADQPEQIVIELSDLDFICSAGLGELISANARSRQHQGVVKLVNPQPFVRDVLVQTNLLSLFPIFASVDEALA